MASTAAQKVVPLNEPVAHAGGGLNNESVEEGNLVLGLNDLAPRDSADQPPPDDSEDADRLKFLLKQVAINKQIERLQEMFTYNYIKSTTQWFLESATCKISITVS